MFRSAKSCAQLGLHMVLQVIIIIIIIILLIITIIILIIIIIIIIIMLQMVEAPVLPYSLVDMTR